MEMDVYKRKRNIDTRDLEGLSRQGGLYCNFRLTTAAINRMFNTQRWYKATL